MRYFLRLAAVVIAIICVLAYAFVPAQERVHVWTFETCYTNACVKRTLEKLSPDRAHDAKLTTWSDTTYIWFRE